MVQLQRAGVLVSAYEENKLKLRKIVNSVNTSLMICQQENWVVNEFIYSVAVALSYAQNELAWSWAVGKMSCPKLRCMEMKNFGRVTLNNIDLIFQISSWSIWTKLDDLKKCEMRGGPTHNNERFRLNSHSRC